MMSAHKHCFGAHCARTSSYCPRSPIQASQLKARAPQRFSRAGRPALHSRIEKRQGVLSVEVPTSRQRIHALASSFPAVAEKTVALPLDYYQVLGADTHFLADAILRAYELRVNHPPEEGFSQDALKARQEILIGACDTLADPDLRGEYNENLAEDEAGAVTVDVPLSKVGGALCLLQEAGEVEVVLQVGQRLLQERLPKPFQRDVILAMALAYVELSREAMADTPPATVRSCELLEKALKLLQEEGGTTLALALQEQIDETLQQLYPRCMLELLALPLSKEHQGKREEGLQGLRSILWAVGEGGVFAPIPGFTREEFMRKAFSCMMASEQMALFIATPSNIPAESSEVHAVALAHVKEGYVGKKPHLIQEADALFLQLQQTNVSPTLAGDYHSGNQQLGFAFERGMCALLLGELDDCRAWLGLDDVNSPYRDPSIMEFVSENSAGSEDGDYLPGLCKLLESWLTDAVFPSSRHVDELQVKLRDYYDDPGVLSYLEKLKKGESPLAAAAAIVQLGAGAGAALDSVKISAIETLHKVFPFGKAKNTSSLEAEKGKSYNEQERQELYRSPHFEDDDGDTPVKVAGLNPEDRDIVQNGNVSSMKVVYAGLLIGALALGSGISFFAPRIAMKSAQRGTASSINTGDTQGSFATARKDSVPRMDVQLAEHLVRNWQTAKAQALGPNHALGRLSEVLGGRMLKSWSERAGEVSKKGWYWEYKLKKVSIESVTISTDGGTAIAEATLEEAASLYDGKNREVTDSYDSRYTTRYEFTAIDGVWKITSGTVLRPR